MIRMSFLSRMESFTTRSTREFQFAVEMNISPPGVRWLHSATASPTSTRFTPPSMLHTINGNWLLLPDRICRYISTRTGTQAGHSMWMWPVTPPPLKPCEMKSLRHRHHGTRLLPDNPFSGFGRDRYPWAVGSGVWKIRGRGQVYEKYSGTTAKWLGFCKGDYEALSQYETGAVCQSYYPYVHCLFFLDTWE